MIYWSIGYSVYAIRRIDPEDSLDIARTHADEVASTLNQPSSAGAAPLTAEPATGSSSRAADPADFGHIEGLEDEDMELQAALQASLGQHEEITIPTGPPRAHAVPRPWEVHSDLPEDEDDPVASSIARSRSAMNQMLRHQEAAMREAREEEVAYGFPPNRYAPLAPPTRLAPAPPARGTQGEEDEDEQLRQALLASRAEAGADMDDDDDDGDYIPPPSRHAPPPVAPAASRAPLADISFAHHTGVYDDDDAELQAALRASLEESPGGAEVPSEVQVSRGAERSPPVSAHLGPARKAPTLLRAPVVDSEDDDDEDEEENKKIEVQKPKEEAKPVDVDEMRRRRLERFGAGPSS